MVVLKIFFSYDGIIIAFVQSEKDITMSNTLPSLMQVISEFRQGLTTPDEIVSTCLDRIESRNPDLNCFCVVDGAAAMEQAARATRRWQHGEPLSNIDGAPVSIKDVMPMAGWPLYYGSRSTAQSPVQDTDCPVVRKLRRLGAVIVGSTTSCEFGWKGVTDSPRYGITRNPRDLTRTPGGSSGGAAASAATEMALVNVGTDGGGSVRIPAAFCGVFGMKPTWGRFNRSAATAVTHLAHTGPITRTASDSAYFLQSWFGAGEPSAKSGHARPRIAWSLGPDWIDLDDDVRSAFLKTIEIIREAGFEVSRQSPAFLDCRETFKIMWLSGFDAWLEYLTPDEREVLDPGLADILDRARSIGRRDLAAAHQRRIQHQIDASVFFDRFDLLLTPATATAAFEVGRNYPATRPGDRDWWDWAPYSYPMNITGLPAASLPAGTTTSGLPVGLQVVAGTGNDSVVLDFCTQMEGAIAGQKNPELT